MLLTEIMSSYLNENEDVGSSFSVENDFRPLKAKESKWDNTGDKLKRVFEFEDRRQLEAFVVELIKYKREAESSFEVRFRDKEVGVIIFGLSGSISELEIEASQDIVKIRKDVVYYYAREK